MAAGLYGADVAQLRRLASKLASAGKQLETQRLSLNAGVSNTRWHGPDGESFRREWTSGHVLALRNAANFLHEAAEGLTRNANEQAAASSASGGSKVFVAGHASLSRRLPTPDPSELAGKTPEQVRDWWAGLSERQQQAFIQQYPVDAGNTNGIPFEDRVEANRINARNRLAGFPDPDPEPVFNPAVLDVGYAQRFRAEHDAWKVRQDAVPYLQQVVDGKIQLAAYDPANHSIVEMIGKYDENTTTVVTYVPGTFTNEASFYGRPGKGRPQDIPNYLVESDRTGGTVAFVYKGSGFPGGFFPEALAEAKSDEFVAASAPVMARFQAAVELERPSGAQTVGISHSWGFRNTAGSEMSGAHYDQVFALSGAAMPPGWTPDPETKYHGFTYIDVLQTGEELGVVGDNYPMKDPAFDRRVYESPGGDDVSDHLNIDNHNLVASTDAENEAVLSDLRTEIYG